MKVGLIDNAYVLIQLELHSDQYLWPSFLTSVFTLFELLHDSETHLNV
jgi:hypothetical protein